MDEETDSLITARLVYALSALLRHLPQAQVTFVEHGGIETMVHLIDRPTATKKIKLRVMELMHDLMVEKEQAEESQADLYETVHLRSRLVDRDWCSHLSLHLTSIDHDDFDQIEKTLTLMIPLADVCRVQFVARLPVLDKLIDVYAKLHPNDESVQRDMLRHLERLRKDLTQTLWNSSDEL